MSNYATAYPGLLGLLYLTYVACHATNGPPTTGPAEPSTANFVAIDDPAGPSMAAMDGPARPSTGP